MKILYLASVRIPNEKASGLAIMRQCEGFSEIGNEVVLLRPHRRNHITEDAFSFYNIKKIFLVQTMPSVDFTSRLGIVGFSLTLLSQMVCALLLLVTRYRHFEVVYSRDPWLLLPIVFFTSGRVVVLEAHKTYQNGVMSLVTRRVALLVCITNKLKETLAKLAERDDILVEPSGVDLAQFTDLPPVDLVRHELGLPRD
jgi:hypothetical protein